MQLTKDWIWCSYTPGAGGKMICSILQLDSKTHPWYTELNKDLDKFINEKIKIPHYYHMKNEPHWPYNLSWYTRQLPFTRGDEFTTEEAEQLFSKHNNNLIKEDMKLLLYKNFIMHWCKPYLPNWFKGQALQIVNDKITSFIAKVDQTGFSINEWNFQIDCRDYPYTEDEKLEAKKKPINKKIDCPENMPKEMCELKQKLDCPENMSINECALKQADAFKKKKKFDGKIGKELTEDFKNQLKENKKKWEESQAGKSKVESKITVNEKEILNMEAYAPFNARALLTFSKAKFFNNDLTNYVFLKNRNYLKFKKGQKLTFDDVKELSERHFFGLPLHNRVDVDRLKKIKKEYFEKKKKLKKSS